MDELRQGWEHPRQDTHPRFSREAVKCIVKKWKSIWYHFRKKCSFLAVFVTLRIELRALLSHPVSPPTPSCPGHFGISFTFYKRCYYFTCMGILPACWYVHHVWAVPIRARREHWVLTNWYYRWLRAAMWVFRSKPGSCGWAASALTRWVIFPGPQVPSDF